MPALTAARAKRALPVVVALVGTEGDPQGWSRQADALAAAGAAVFASNAAARGTPSTCWECLLDDPGWTALRPRPIVAAGVDVFSDALRAQGADVHDVDWRPPGFGDPADLAALALDPRRASANRTAVERVLAAGSQLVDVRPAREVIGLRDRTLLHSGPPLTWEMASGPMRGALIGACLFEGWASTSRRPSGSWPPARSRSTRATTTARSARWPA